MKEWEMQASMVKSSEYWQPLENCTAGIDHGKDTWDWATADWSTALKMTAVWSKMCDASTGLLIRQQCKWDNAYRGPTWEMWMSSSAIKDRYRESCQVKPAEMRATTLDLRQKECHMGGQGCLPWKQSSQLIWMTCSDSNMLARYDLFISTRRKAVW